VGRWEHAIVRHTHGYAHVRMEFLYRCTTQCAVAYGISTCMRRAAWVSGHVLVANAVHCSVQCGAAGTYRAMHVRCSCLLLLSLPVSPRPVARNLLRTGARVRVPSVRVPSAHVPRHVRMFLRVRVPTCVPTCTCSYVRMFQSKRPTPVQGGPRCCVPVHVTRTLHVPVSLLPLRLSSLGHDSCPIAP
jgi:hypothetical protein